MKNINNQKYQYNILFLFLYHSRTKKRLNASHNRYRAQDNSVGKNDFIQKTGRNRHLFLWHVYCEIENWLLSGQVIESISYIQE
jgi:hypothetical protein